MATTQTPSPVRDLTGTTQPDMLDLWERRTAEEEFNAMENPWGYDPDMVSIF